MGLSITKFEMPKNDVMEWGIIQVNYFEQTYFRFDIKDGKPVLDTSCFNDKVKDPENKHKSLSPYSNLYKDLQKLLEERFNREVVKGG